MAITQIQPFNLNNTASYTFGNIDVPGNVSVMGNITTGYIIGNGSQISGVSASSVNASNITGTTMASSVVNSSLTSVGTLTSLNSGAISSSGNVTASYFFGNGSQLTGIDATSIQNGTSNVKVVSSGGNVSVSVGGTSDIAVFATTGEYVTGIISASGNITGGNISGTNITGTLTTASQTNITSVGTLTSLNSGAISSSGNVTGTNILTGGLVSATGNVIGNNINATNWVTGANVSTGGNVLVDGYISVTGNLYVANIVSTSNLVVQDPLVYLTANATYPYNYDIGFYSQFTGNPGNTYQHTGFIRDYTDDTWKLFSNVVAEPSGTVNLTNAIYDPLKMGALTATSGSFSSTLSATGNITGNYFFGNGSQLTGITSTTITNDTTTNATYYPALANATSGTLGTAFVSNTKLTFNPSTGDMGATNFNSLSDENKKTDIETIVEAVELLMHLRGVFFRWKDNGRRSMGMIAQEVERVLPDVVSTDENGVKSISYGSVVGLLVEVVKDHEIRLQRLETQA